MRIRNLLNSWFTIFIIRRLPPRIGTRKCRSVIACKTESNLRNTKLLMGKLIGQPRIQSREVETWDIAQQLSKYFLKRKGLPKSVATRMAIKFGGFRDTYNSLGDRATGRHNPKRKGNGIMEKTYKGEVLVVLDGPQAVSYTHLTLPTNREV